MEAEAFAALERGDGRKALEIFKKLAALGSGVADYCVGDIYLHGQGGVSHDPAEAKKWYKKAFASSIERLSQYAGIKLGYIYEAGYDEANHYGAAIDDEKAFYYYKRAENSDIAIGLLRLGIMYEMGKGTPKDLDKAMALYRQAASRHVVALKNLGSLKVRSGDILSGYLLWGSAILETFFLALFKRNSRRLAML
jgi:TPR repeat protein